MPQFKCPKCGERIAGDFSMLAHKCKSQERPEAVRSEGEPTYGNALCQCGHLSSHHNCDHATADDSCFHCGCEAFVAAKVVGRSEGEPSGALRAAWEAGFKLAVGYGDNWIHSDGEQKERQWQRYLEEAALAEPSGAAESSQTDYNQIRQILAADMTVQPSDAPLPEPRQPLGPVALAVYGLVQETRQLRGER